MFKKGDRVRVKSGGYSFFKENEPFIFHEFSQQNLCICEYVGDNENIINEYLHDCNFFDKNIGCYINPVDMELDIIGMRKRKLKGLLKQ